MGNPLRRRRLALLVIAAAAIIAGLASWLRDRTGPGTTRHSATYLLDVLGWGLVVAGVVLEATVGNLLLDAGLRAARRRAILFSVLGLGVALTACITIPGRSDDGLTTVVRPLAAAALVGGAGIGLAGLATIAVFYGGRYAANRIARMGDEDW